MVFCRSVFFEYQRLSIYSKGERPRSPLLFLAPICASYLFEFLNSFRVMFHEGWRDFECAGLEVVVALPVADIPTMMSDSGEA